MNLRESLYLKSLRAFFSPSHPPTSCSKGSWVAVPDPPRILSHDQRRAISTSVLFWPAGSNMCFPFAKITSCLRKSLFSHRTSGYSPSSLLQIRKEDKLILVRLSEVHMLATESCYTAQPEMIHLGAMSPVPCSPGKQTRPG